MSGVRASTSVYQQIEALVGMNRVVQVERPDRNYYEVTMWPAHTRDHAHFGGASLAEAMSRAFKSTFICARSRKRVDDCQCDYCATEDDNA